jgi:mannose-1-phosphate guanylyltransferase
MKAILLAAGLGTRLKPLTDTVPKCLVPIAGKPLLQIWLEKLSVAGIGPCLVNTHYLPEMVRSFAETNQSAKKVKLVHEEVLLGTAGTLRKNLDFFCGEDGMLIHADNYCEADLREFVHAHKKRPKNCLMTMMAFRTNTPESCGILEVDSSGIVIGFHEKVENPPGNLANGAIYIIGTELLGRLASNWHNESDFSNGIIPDLVGSIYVYETNQVFADIGSMKSYIEIKAMFSR